MGEGDRLALTAGLTAIARGRPQSGGMRSTWPG